MRNLTKKDFQSKLQDLKIKKFKSRGGRPIQVIPDKKKEEKKKSCRKYKWR